MNSAVNAQIPRNFKNRNSPNSGAKRNCHVSTVKVCAVQAFFGLKRKGKQGLRDISVRSAQQCQGIEEPERRTDADHSKNSPDSKEARKGKRLESNRVQLRHRRSFEATGAARLRDAAEPVTSNKRNYMFPNRESVSPHSRSFPLSVAATFRAAETRKKNARGWVFTFSVVSSESCSSLDSY
jgi:hypothetical protein